MDHYLILLVTLPIISPRPIQLNRQSSNISSEAITHNNLSFKLTQRKCNNYRETKQYYLMYHKIAKSFNTEDSPIFKKQVTYETNKLH